MVWTCYKPSRYVTRRHDVSISKVSSRDVFHENVVNSTNNSAVANGISIAFGPRTTQSQHHMVPKHGNENLESIYYNFSVIFFDISLATFHFCFVPLIFYSLVLLFQFFKKQTFFTINIFLF